MRVLRTFWLKFRSLRQHREVKREIDEELRFHLEQRVAESIAAGMSPDEASREARKRFGNMQSTREECRERRGVAFAETVLQDVRFGFRMLWKNSGFTFVVVLTLAFGVGASTAIYSVVNSLLLNPIPAPAGSRLIQIAERTYFQGGFREQNGSPTFDGVSPPVLDALLARREYFAQLAWADGITLERTTEDFTEDEGGYAVSPNFFELWKVAPLLGRTFAQDEAVLRDELDKPVRDAVMVISCSWWKSQFGGDPKVIGKTIALSGRNFTVVGVMPAQFQFPWGRIKYWLPAEPIHLPPGWGRPPNTHVFARLKLETTTGQMQAMLDTVAHQLPADPGLVQTYRQEWNRRPGGLGFQVRPARYQFTDGREDLERTLFGLLAAIGFVLLIVCSNVANLSLARIERRQQEFAMRAALGASRARLARQFLTESITLACLGGLGGLAVAALGVRLLGVLVPDYMPRLKPLQVDADALGFTLLITIAAGLAFGCVPAWHAGRAGLGEALKQGGSQATTGRTRKRFRGGLVVVEFALAVVLMAGAGLMIESVVNLLRVDPGFKPENLVRIDLELPWDKYSDPEHRGHAAQLRRVIYGEISDRLAALPGVKAVGIGKHGAWPSKLQLEGSEQPVEVLLDGCGVGSSDLFQAMRIPLRAGRYFDSVDTAEGVGTTVVNETMARTLWPGENAVGKRFVGETTEGRRQFEVIGVVGDIRDYSYSAQVRPAFYRPEYELSLEGMRPFVVVRTAGDPRALIPAIRRELKAAEPSMHTPSISLCEQTLYDSTVAQRTYMLFLVVFAAVGLLLAALGVYGVLAYSVARRTREIGIRMALGARRRHVLRSVMGEGLRLAGCGAALGLIGSYWLMGLLRSQLFGVRPTDPGVIAGTALMLVFVAALACLLPALRAVRIDPMKALRYE